MGRLKKYDRLQLLDKAVQVFWKQGFSDTSLCDLEAATGVNKSGIYSEFQGKDDLFLQSLKHYIVRSGVTELLVREPLGWKNIESFLKISLSCKGQKGCFVANSIRESAILPARAKEAMAKHTSKVKTLLAENLRVEGLAKNDSLYADLILTFNSGLCLEQNASNCTATEEKVNHFLRLLKASS